MQSQDEFDKLFRFTMKTAGFVAKVLVAYFRYTQRRKAAQRQRALIAEREAEPFDHHGRPRPEARRYARLAPRRI